MAVTAVLDKSPDNGVLNAFNADGSFEYVHNGGPSTEDTIKYHLEDDQGNVSNTATVTITVNQTAAGGSIVTTETEVTTNVALQNWGAWSYIGYDIDSPLIHKSGNGLVSNLTYPESIQGTHNIDFSWLNGDLVVEESSVGLAFKLDAITKSIEFDLDADTNEKVRSIFITALNCEAEVRLSLNDNSAVDNIDNLDSPSLAKKTWKIDATYTAGSTTKLHAIIKPKNPHGDAFFVLVGVVAANEGADSGNLAPTVTGPSNFSVNEMELFEIVFQGSDPDDSPVTPMNFSLAEHPESPKFMIVKEQNGNEYKVFWRPDKGEAGTHDFRVVGDDGDKTAEDNVRVTVNSGSTRMKANDKKVVS